jgi:20S proteasome subunit alpha 6
MLEYLALAIGARSQSARTYLERHLSEFPECDVDTLVQHGLKALRETLQQDKDLTLDNTSIVCLFVVSRVADRWPQGIISPTQSLSAIPADSPFRTGSITKPSQTDLPPFFGRKQEGFRMLEGDQIKPYLEKLEPKEGVKQEDDDDAPAAPTDGTAEQPAPIDVD